MEDLELPETIKKQIRSKPKLVKLSFLNKLDLLLEWAKDDDNKIEFIGFKKLENDDFCVNLPVLAKHFDIQERSLCKNFLLSNYQRSQNQPRKDRVIFTNQKDNYSIVKTYNIVEKEVGKEGAENWNSDMINIWDKFIKKYPEKKVSDFVKQFGIHRAVLHISQLIEYLIQSTEFDAATFQFIFLHFSPVESIIGKVSTLLSSIFSRGWTIGEGPKTVKLIQPYGFLFDDGNQQIMIYNILNCYYPGLWLNYPDELGNYEPESLFETFFPTEIPSNDNYIDILVNYFPEVIDENDETDDNEEF